MNKKIAKFEKIRMTIFIMLITSISVLLLGSTMLSVDTEKKLYGSTIDTEKPIVYLKTIMAGTWQSQFDDWYLENFPFRYYFVKLYNQIMYCFKETNNRIVVGKDDYLFGVDYVDSFIKREEISNRDEVYDKYAKEISYVKEYLEKLDKKFIYIISPSKACLYPENLPDRYINLERKDRISNLEYEKIVLDEYDVNYVDANIYMSQMKNDGIMPYYKQGIHWNCAGSATFLKMIDDIYDIVPGKMEVKLTEIRKASFDNYIYGELDLWSLLNIFEKPVEDTYWTTNIEFDDIEDSYKNIFILGTSFSGLPVELLNGALSDSNPKYNKLIRYNYLDTGYYYDGGNCVEENFSQDILQTDIIDSIMNSDIIIIENNSSYLPDSFSIVADYLYKNLR